MLKSYYVEFENREEKGFYGYYKSKAEAKQILGFNAGRNIKTILTLSEYNKIKENKTKWN